MKTTHFSRCVYLAPSPANSRCPEAAYVRPAEDLLEVCVLADFIPCDIDGVPLSGYHSVPLPTSDVPTVPVAVL